MQEDKITIHSDGECVGPSGIDIADSAKTYPHEWEPIDKRTARLRVPGGWLVQVVEVATLAQAPPPGVLNARPTTHAISISTSITVLSDPNHEWVLEPLPKKPGAEQKPDGDDNAGNEESTIDP